MAFTEQQIVSDIIAYIRQSGVGYKSWYVGISQDARDRLFNGHAVRENGDWWIFRQAQTSRAARNVEAYFVNTLRTDGGTGGGDANADFVYAYIKNLHTNP